jgi:hypothetical protein
MPGTAMGHRIAVTQIREDFALVQKLVLVIPRRTR